MNEKELAIYIKEDILKSKKEIGEQFICSYFKLFKEPFNNLKDINLLIKEAKNIGITIQYAQESKYYRNFKNDNFQTIIAYLSNDTL